VSALLVLVASEKQGRETALGCWQAGRGPASANFGILVFFYGSKVRWSPTPAGSSGR